MAYKQNELTTLWKGVFLLVVAGAIGMRMVWQSNPGTLTCVGFWSLSMLWGALIIFKLEYISSKVARGVMQIGALLNMVVTLANGGYMPVTSMEENHSLWVVAEDTHNMMFLADIYAGWSIGDFIITSGLVLISIFWGLRKWGGLEHGLDSKFWIPTSVLKDGWER